jgi:CheY-like chemotaxis protein
LFQVEVCVHRILIVDDDKATCDVLRACLSEGYEVIDTRDPEQALLRKRLSKATSEMSAQFASLARTTPATSAPAPHAALAYATARQPMGTRAIARPHLTAMPFAAILGGNNNASTFQFSSAIRIHQEYVHEH